MATVLDGRVVRDAIRKTLKKRVAALRTKPTLVIFQVGDKAESTAYIRQKLIFGESIGARVIHKKFPASISRKKLAQEIRQVNTAKTAHGIIVQMPLPRHIAPDIVENISPGKDVDGLTSGNLGHLLTGDGRGYLPATVKGIFSLLDFYRIDPAEKKAVIVGRSLLVGKPLALALINRDATVTVCHSRTKNLAEETRRADIVIAVAGKAKLIGNKHLSRGQTVIDVGINAVNGKLTGDVDFKAALSTAKAVTPVPGGVGPLTVASLFENLIDAHALQSGARRHSIKR